jgi:uncharacterized protein with ParB-like and HNH nuclease domain
MVGDILNFEAKNRSLASFARQWAPSSYIIPDFQRRFVWETKQLTDFLDSIVNGEPGYYIGTVVIVRPDYTSHDIEIIDGQQRLTTISLSLKVLLDMLDTQSEEKVKFPEDIENFINILLVNNKKPRLTFNDPYFANHLKVLLTHSNPLNVPDLKQWFTDIKSRADEIGLNEGPLKVKQELAHQKAVSRLFNTYKDIQNFFEKLPRAELIEVISKLSKLQIIEIMCEEHKIVNTLFEGLNSKGIQLNNAELIKNKLYGRIDRLDETEEMKNSIKEVWGEMDLLFFVEADKRLIDKYLRHYWISRNGHIAGSELYDQYAHQIDSLKSKGDIKDFVQELHRYANYYIAIRNLQFNHETYGLKIDPNVYSLFNDFGRLNNDQIYEVLLALIKLIKDDEFRQIIATKDLKLLLNKLWIFCFRLQFISVRTSQYEHRFADLCAELRNWVNEGKPLAAFALNFIDTKLKILVNDGAQFQENLSSQFSYKNSTQSKRLLEKVFYDIFAAYDKTKDYDASYMYKKPTIEHILPQKPAKWGFRTNEVSDFVNNIGNLTLLDEKENSGAEDEVFGVKLKKVYSKSKYSFNKDISKYQKSFDSGSLAALSEVIDKRAREIAKLLNDAYSL